MSTNTITTLTATFATGEQADLNLGQSVYVDLGDGIDGGEVSGTIEALSALFMTVDGYRVPFARVIDFQED